MDASIQSYGGNVFHSCAIYVARGFFSFHLCFQSLFDVLLAVIQYYMPFINECQAALCSRQISSWGQ